ncbi:hypothetical protein LI043_12680 [Clostridium perfringens]|uniref:hypothetical protein n=1 Tax=Clostridium perfringens TaxID=1502 RepID=UPI0022450550|nr:hypothetical protein [Clostridium perfringens]MCX0389511.1 hypothetical protein [Clostridium perfringens]
MFLFPFVPVPIALILLILVIAMGLYYSFYIKLNKFESNKLEVIERQIMKITNVLLVYIIIMAMFRNDGEAKFYIGYFGTNISLVLFYISLVGSYLVLREERKIEDREKLVYIKFINHKKALYYLIGATFVMRFSFKAYLESSKTSVLRLIIIFILLCLFQYEINKNLQFYTKKKVSSIRDIINKNNLKKNIVLGLILIFSVTFTSGKYFLSPKEKKMQKYTIECQESMHELFE